MANEAAAVEAPKRGRPAKNVSKLADVAKVSELKELGWTVSKSVDGTRFVAREHRGKGEGKTIEGTSVAAVHTAVKIEMDRRSQRPKGGDKTGDKQIDDAVERLDAGAADRPVGDDHLFEEMRPKPQSRCRELELLADQYDEYKMQRVELSKKESEAKKLLYAAMLKNEESLALDKHTGVKSYTTKAGTVVELVPGDPVVKTHRNDEDDE